MSVSGSYLEFVAAVESVTGRQGRRMGRNIRLLCPAHDDRNPSLDVAEGDDGRPLVLCRAGCSYEAICEAIDWAPRREPNLLWTPAGDAVAVYDYVDESGRLLFQVRRAAGKRFYQCRPDPTSKSGWRFNLDGVRRVPYRLPEVVTAVARGDEVFVCEGEKDADAVRAAGAVATCNPGGAGKWRPEYTATLAGDDPSTGADESPEAA